jgi:hypothetical protein
VDPDRTLEALERDFSEVLESETLPDAELANHVRYETLFRLRMGTEARGELNRRPEEIHMVLDGLSRRGANPDLNRDSPFLLPILRQCAMDSSGATGRSHRRQETCHDAVACMLYLAAT